MNANDQFLARDAHVDDAAVQPLPNSRKIYVEGSRADVRVPMREIAQADTPASFGAEVNPPLAVYDTSGPYTDAAFRADLAAGLPALRARWIAERNDTEELPDFTSPFTRRHASARELADVRWDARTRTLSGTLLRPKGETGFIVIAGQPGGKVHHHPITATSPKTKWQVRWKAG